MGHLIKYRFLQITREWSVMFWALAFPIVLGVFFYMSFGSGNMGEDMEIIPVAVVEENTETDHAKAFAEFLDHMDGDMIKTKVMKESEAIDALMADEVTGIFYIEEKPSLSVAKSELEQSILKSILDSYNKNAAMIMTVAEEHPEMIGQAMEALDDWQEVTEEVSIGGKTTDPNVQYFFVLIAYACLGGAFLGVKSSFDSQANLSALGARRSVTPTNKLKLVLVDMAVLCGIHFVNILIVTSLVRFGFGIHLGGNLPMILLVVLLGSVIGISLGIMIGCVSRLSVGMKMGLTVTVTLVCGFMAGLMFGNMKDIIEHNIPIINRINPAAVLSDAFYCMGVYNDVDKFTRCLVILGVMSIVCIVVAFLSVRRERYDSI